MHFVSSLLSIALVCLSATGFGQDRLTLSGIVRDAVTGEGLIAAHVRVLGTARGTITNPQGKYSLQLDRGEYRIVFSTLGYRPDTAEISLQTPTVKDVRLVPSPIALPEVVVTSEDPAYEIIRRAIAAKRMWIDRLASYSFEAFTRQILRRDTAIASINESYTRGYWQQGDTLREVIRQRRQTSNIQASFNFASVGRIINFNEDEVWFLGYTFVGPTSPDAFDYYTYKLLRTRSDSLRRIYEIRMTPRTKTAPLFNGIILIADGSYALVGVDVEPNEAFIIPFLKDRKLRYRQEFALYDESYWLPVDIRIDGHVSISIVGFSFPSVGFEQTSVIYDYAVNTSIPDSVFLKPRLTVDSSATRYDSTFWTDNAVLPLGSEEQDAYRTLDSTKTLDVQFRPGGIGMTIGGGSELLEAVIEYADVGFNRVEGYRIGARADDIHLGHHLSFRGGLAYGISDRRTKYEAGMTIYPLATKELGVGGDVFRNLGLRPDTRYYGQFFNSLTSLVARNDYFDYYEREGWKAFLQYTPSERLSAAFTFASEYHSTARQSTDQSFFTLPRQYRPNPVITDGQLRSIRLDLRLGTNEAPFDILPTNTLRVSAEHSPAGFAGSEFTFTRYDALASFVLPTFARSMLFSPQLRVRIGAGASSGTLPPQRWFDPQSGSSGYAPFGTMKAMQVRAYSGTGYVSVSAEHNFRTLPFLALGIPFLYERNLELVVHGGAVRTWGKEGLPLNTTDGWYAEAGIGLSRIFDILRMDLTWRFADPARLIFTMSVAQIL